MTIHRVNMKLDFCQQVTLTGPPISVLGSRTDNVSFDLWYEDMGIPHVYTIYLLMTGGPVPWNNNAERDMLTHLGTYIALDGHHVGHVYLEKP